MQSLYAYFTLREQDTAKAQKQMLKQIDSILDLYLILLSLLPALADFSKGFLEEQKNKHFPTESDINPNERFVNNQLISLILSDKNFKKQLEKASEIWHNNDHDIIRKLFIEIWKSDLYAHYIVEKDTSFRLDQEFIISLTENLNYNEKDRAAVTFSSSKG